MDTMQKVTLGIHTLIALSIIALVLLQRGKGADAGAAFGAGASGTVFGARGSSSFFSRATAVLATAFFASSLILAYMSSQRTTGPSSLLEDAPVLEVEAGAEADSTDVIPDAELPAVESNEAPLDLPELEEDAPVEPDGE